MGVEGWGLGIGEAGYWILDTGLGAWVWERE